MSLRVNSAGCKNRFIIKRHLFYFKLHGESDVLNFFSSKFLYLKIYWYCAQTKNVKFMNVLRMSGGPVYYQNVTAGCFVVGPFVSGRLISRTFRRRTFCIRDLFRRRTFNSRSFSRRAFCKYSMPKNGFQ